MKFRVKLDANYKERASGPNMFMSRIIRALEKNHGVRFTPKKPHISLGVIFLPEKGAKRVVRIDGCYYNKFYLSSSVNKAVARSISKADGVIFQSEFSKNLCEKLLGCSARNHCIIYNGIDQNWVDSIVPDTQIAENTFVAVASWRNSKRPKSIIKSFIDANISNSHLVMIGKLDKKIKHPNITYTGNLSSESVIAKIKSCRALIHLCKIESCPNTVIEALSCKIPVVCNNIGGTPEIVKSDGIIVNCDEDFKFKYINEKNVDNISSDVVVPALVNVLNRKWEINRTDLNIDFCAKSYYNFFKKICNV